MAVVMEIKEVDLAPPEGANLIFGQAHFIKTVEDLAEVLAGSMPGIEFAVAFAESSGKRELRFDGNDPQLIERACSDLMKIGAGHSFLIYMRKAFPINVLNDVKAVPEVAGIYCATANPVKVFLAVDGEAIGVLGVADGLRPQRLEDQEGKRERKELLRKLGYKRGRGFGSAGTWLPVRFAFGLRQFIKAQGDKTAWQPTSKRVTDPFMPCAG